VTTAPAVDTVVEQIGARGWSVVADFVSAAMIAGLRARALALDREGLLAPAKVGRGTRGIERADIRGDRIRWLTGADALPVEHAAEAALEALRLAANRALQLGLFEFEGHYAVYPPGAGYARHVDRFRDDDARVLSIVLYLNTQWHANDGGALRLHVADDAVVDVAPDGGTLVAFLADRFEHEVLVSRRSRLSLTGWFRRR
jgi:SM-20-related protein